MKVKVANMTSNKGNKVPNQFEIEVGRYVYFQSYNTIIARYDHKTMKTVLDGNSWDCSVTTTRYRNQFLGCNTQECREKIKLGIYKLADLNK